MKNISQLLDQVKDMGKQASADPENCTDPNVKGEVTRSETGTASETVKPKGEAGKEDASPMSDATGKGESPGDEPNPTKLAARMESLREKLAAELAGGNAEAPEKEAGEAPAPEAGKTETPEKEAGEATAPEAGKTEAPEKEAGEAPAAETPEKAASVLEKYSGIIVNALLKTASGRQTINDCMNELQGDLNAREIIDKAAAAQEEIERHHLEERFSRIERAKQAHAANLHRQRLEESYRELTKSASADDLAASEEATRIIMKHASIYSEHPLAEEAFAVGCKAAAAMMEAEETGAEDPMAEAAPVQEGAPVIEELMMALQELVESGEVDPATAEQVLALLAEGMGGGSGKEASANTADDRDNAIFQIVHNVLPD